MKRNKGTQRGRGELWWVRLIERQAKSGRSVKELCAEAGVTEQSFYWWRKRLAGRGGTISGFTEVELGLVNECEIRCRSGRSVVVRGAVSAEVLQCVLHAAEGGSL